jgi:hypothetical protein
MEAILILTKSRNNNTKAYQIPSCRTEIRKESYFLRTIRDWNALPDNCVTIGSLETFKAHLQDMSLWNL